MLNFAATSLHIPPSEALNLSPEFIYNQMMIERTKLPEESRTKVYSHYDKLEARKNILDQMRVLYAYR